MRLNLYRFLPFSFVDAPETTAVVFCKGCNIRCPYCYNIDLLNEAITEDDLEKNEILEKIAGLQQSNKNTGMIFNTVSYLTISGGEPTFRSGADMKLFLMKAKDLGLKTGIYTNGFDGFTIVDLIDEGLLNFVHLDVKETTFDHMTLYNFWSLLQSHKFEQLQLNTTIYKSKHNEAEVIRLKKEVKQITGDFSFSREKFKEPFSYTLTPFYNNNDTIKTFGNLTSLENHFTDDELNALLRL
jgi:pyruvate-formate lyase-activating enzyme